MFNLILRRTLSPKTTPNGVLLLLQRNPFTKSLSQTPKPPNPSSPTVSYLITSCGLSPESALLASQKIQLKTTQKPDSVLELFHHYGLTQIHLAKIIAKHPTLLTSNAHKSLKPKLEFFHGLGFSGPTLARLLTLAPLLLRRSLAKHLIPCFNFLRTILHTNKNIVAVFSSAPRGLQANLTSTMIPGIKVLRTHGVPEPRISKLVIVQPGILLHRPKRVGEMVEEVKKMGIHPSDMMFIYAFGTLSGMAKPTWERKMAAYMSFGLSESEVMAGFRKLPTCMKVSEEKIRRGMGFFVRRLKMSPTAVMVNPNILFAKLEKTIIPRCSVLNALMSRGKIKRDLSLVAALALPKKLFVERYVSKYEEEVPEVVEAYQGKIEFKGLEMGCSKPEEICEFSTNSQ